MGPRTPTLMVSPEAAASAPVEAAVEAAVLLEEPPQAVRTPAAATTPAAARKLRREIIFFIVNFLLGNIRDSIIKTEARPLPSKRPCFVINIIDPPPQMRNSQTVHTFGFRLWTLLTKWLKPHRCFCALFQVVHFICASDESNSQIAKGLQGLHFGVCGKHSLSTCPGSFALCFCFGRRLCKDLADGGKVEHQ